VLRLSSSKPGEAEGILTIPAQILTPHRHLMALLLLAAVLRLALPVAAVTVGRNSLMFSESDSSYLALAAELLASGSFGTEPEVYITPGYPIFLLPGMASSHFELITLLFQVIASCVTLVFVYRTSILLFERKSIATGASLLYAVDPVSVLLVTWVMAETLFTTLIMAFLFYLLKYLGDPKQRRITVSAFALSLAIYVRPIAYYLPFVIAAGLLLWACGNVTRRRACTIHVGVFLLVSAAPLGLWQYRNYLATGIWQFSVVADTNLFTYQAAAVQAVVQGKPFEETKDQMSFDKVAESLARRHENRTVPPSEVYQYMRTEGWRILSAHPGVFARIYMTGIVHTLIGPGAEAYLRYFRIHPEGGRWPGEVFATTRFLDGIMFFVKHRPDGFWTNVVLGFVLLAYLGLAGVGLCVSRPLSHAPKLFFLLVASYLLVASGGPIGNARFRVPLVPMISIFAGVGLCLARRACRKGLAGGLRPPVDRRAM